MDDKDLDFAAFMEQHAGPEFAAELKAIADGEVVTDETWLMAATPMQIKDMRLLVEAVYHVMDHACTNAWPVIAIWLGRQMETMVPFLAGVDSGELTIPASIVGDEVNDERGDGASGDGTPLG